MSKYEKAENTTLIEKLENNFNINIEGFRSEVIESNMTICRLCFRAHRSFKFKIVLFLPFR